MKTTCYLFWIIFGFIVSCSSHAATHETWVIDVTALDATTGKVLKHAPLQDEKGKLKTFKDGPDCVKAAMDMGPMPVRNNVAISMVCHRVDHL